MTIPTTVDAVSRSEAHGFCKQPQPYIELLAGEGVQGDAHRGTTTQHLYLKRKNPMQPNLAQVHLFSAEMLEEIAAKGFPLTAGEIGENILTRGLDLLALPQDTRLHLGEKAVVRITGLRTPCAQIDGHRKGLQALLWGARDATNQRTRRAGVMSVVVVSGVVRGGDTIVIELPAPPFLPLGPV